MSIEEQVPLSQEEMAANYQTFRHIERVRALINSLVVELLKRGEKHDQSKLLPPEVAAFTKHNDNLSKTTYGSKEYHEQLDSEDLSKALEHHYAKNRHHPQHFKDGIDDMNLLDLLEMFVDWKASSERHHDGNILKSIAHNAGRFKISPQLVSILENTAQLFDSE